MRIISTTTKLQHIPGSKGNFDQALSDYLLSGQPSLLSKPQSKPSFEFEQALFQSLVEGGKDAAIDFIPSLCNSTYGMGKVLWACGSHPIESSKCFVNACNEMANVTYSYFKGLDKSQLEEYCEELKSLYKNFYSLADEEKGRLIGYTIGKYGVDIFAGSVAIKGIAAFNRLKAANQLCNLEAMSISTANKEIVIAQAIKHAEERAKFFNSVKYNFNSHNKHILNHHHYRAGNSIWEHKNPEGLLRHFAGTGIPTRGQPGIPGYKETIDFKEYIGIWISQNGKIQLPTTRGTIHYGNKGAHIVPSDPAPKIGKKS